MLGANRFLNEIRISARLDHPHILTLIDSGAADGFLYYVMPFVRGESLRDRLKRDKQLGVDEALDITRQITSALDYAHRHGLVHRDIKPENILLHEGEAMLADFGIAMAVKEAGGKSPDRKRRVAGHAAVHESRTGHRRSSPRCPQRCLLDRGRAVRDACRRAAAQRRFGPGDHCQAPDGAADAASRASRHGAGSRRRGGGEGAREAARRPLRDCG